jgi:alkylation response protein AidB-like acyl-CoA dehydrogenase
MLGMVVSHTGSRVQFNVPVGGFQAVKHGVADAHVRNEVAWSAILHACAASSSEFGYRAKIARFLAVEAALQSSRAAAQFFGGMGFTWESDLHFYLKAVLDATQRFGAADQLAARIGRQFMEVSC